MYNPFTLEGKTILVTGASSGIGRSTAIECSKLGARLFITGRNEERLKETLGLLSGIGHVMIKADLNNDSDISNLSTNSPLLDGIVHCAGRAFIKPLKSTKREDINAIFADNVFAPMLLTTSLLKKKKIKDKSSIVFVSSMAGTYNSKTCESVYSATKSSLLGYVRSSAVELAPRQIRVNAICPGGVQTPLLNTFTDICGKDGLESIKNQYPLKRFGKPEEIAYLAIYLLSDTSEWMTGSNILIDGGYTLQ
jgi:NAD(P)-dependent dehydrogenase (short-subunit alcohol dehydrogenase family)